MSINCEQLRRFTIARNFLKPTTLKRALHRMGFVQADPIRSPARAQDLIMRHRVKHYRAGDLEGRYATLGIEEDVFVNYGYVTRDLQALMHPRSDSREPADEVGKPWCPAQRERAELLLGYVRERGDVHPREVDEYFSHGRVKNYWGGSSNATTHLLEAMHYRGMLRVARREKGIRVYTAHEHGPGTTAAAERRARLDALVDAVVRIYAPLPGPSLASYVRRLRFAVPQWQAEITSALHRAKEQLSHAAVEGVDWYWPVDETGVFFGDEVKRVTGNSQLNKAAATEFGHHNVPLDVVRLLSPFDPVVHDRTRFKLLWGWEYRFEAYTPVAKRKLGYYAMPLLWRDRVIGWANIAVKNGELEAQVGYVRSRPRELAFKRELAAELERMRAFLRLK